MFTNGKKLIFDDKNDLKDYLSKNLVTHQEAQVLLELKSTTALSSIISRRKIKPILEWKRIRIFWREDILKRKDEAARLREQYKIKRKGE